MPKDQQKHGTRRQRPVSCRFCRSRKLRCSRESQCSNCISRGIRCELEEVLTPSAAAPKSPDADLLERIRRLEALVAAQTPHRDESPWQNSESSDTIAVQPSDSSPQSQSDHVDKDVAWLESIYSGQDLSTNIPGNRIVFKICSITQAMEAQPYILQNSSTSSTTPEPIRCIWLPPYSEMMILLPKYFQHIDHIHHITHNPSLIKVIDDTYEDLNLQRCIKPGSIILLLGIIASCTHSWVQADCQRGLFSEASKAQAQAIWWIKNMEDVLDIAHRQSQISLEGIQGWIIASFVVGSSVGFGHRGKAWFNMVFLLSRELGLHGLDHPSNAHEANSFRTEIGRRVWWYVVASDWAMAARISSVGPSVYTCHLRQMVTRKPLNIDDEDLIDGITPVGKPIDQPTTMSYSLLRIRLAEISRSIVDRTPLVARESRGPSHDVVMDLDTEMQTLLNDVPAFFSLSTAELQHTYQLDRSRALHIGHQRYIFSSLLHSQRCQLHLPYLGRGSVDSTYAISREICIQSACAIIQTELQLEKAGLCLVTRYRFCGMQLGVFLASIVLLMDLCHSKSMSLQAKRREELVDAFRILEEAKHESHITATFLDSMMNILSKHRISPPKHAIRQPLILKTHTDYEPVSLLANGRLAPDTSLLTTRHHGTRGLLVANHFNDTNLLNDGHLGSVDSPSFFDELNQSLEQGTDLGTFDWESIFTGLESSFI